MDIKETKKLAKTPIDEELGGGGETIVDGPSTLSGDGVGDGLQAAGVFDVGVGVVGVVGVLVEGGVAPGELETVMASF